jgi:hypothetical protein
MWERERDYNCSFESVHKVVALNQQLLHSATLKPPHT